MDRGKLTYTKLYSETKELQDLCSIYSSLYGEDEANNAIDCWPMPRIKELSDKLRTSVCLRTKGGLIILQQKVATWKQATE
jgi:hypothetical protein